MVSNYFVYVYLTTRSYEAALASIQRIQHPDSKILEAKQKILFQLGTQAFANTNFPKAISFFDQAIALGQYNQQTRTDALFWRGESYYRLGDLAQAEQNFRQYLQLNKQPKSDMHALAFYNLGYIAF